MHRGYTALAAAINHPDAINPYYGLFNYRILRSLARAGTAVDVVSPRPFTPPVGPYAEFASLPATADWGPYTVHHPRFWYLLPKRLFYGLSGDSYATRVPEYVERTFETPDVVHACHLYPDGYGMMPYARDHDVPLFVVAHGTLLNDLGSHPPGVDEKIRQTLVAADGVLCVSDSLASKARRLTNASTVETVPIGAAPEHFPVERAPQLRRELDIPADATVVLFVGAFTEAKGVADICAALPALDLEDTVFVFVGRDGPLEDRLRTTVTESGFSNRYIYTGLPPVALRRWYAVADLLLLPSHSEGRPTVIYEAMASKTAVLASDIDGIPEQVVDGETGVLIPARNVDVLVDSLESLATDRPHLHRLGAAGHQRLLEQNWTWEGHANRVQKLHREALRGEP